MRNNPYTLALLEIWVWVSCWLWSVAHHSIAHPLIPFLPKSISHPIRDWTYKHKQAAISRKRWGYLMDDEIF